MVKAVYPASLLLFSALSWAQDNNFSVLPQACISAKQQSCKIDLSISWHFPVPVCLNQQQQPGRALVCGTDIDNYTLSVDMDSNLVLELRHHHHKTLVASKTIKYLQQAEISAVSPRRLSWSIF